MKKKKKSSLIWNIILVVAIGAFAFSGYKLWSIYSEYEQGDEEYEKIQNTVINRVEINIVDDPEEIVEEEPPFVVDFVKLKEMNSDAVAWIRFDEPAIISYPVVKGKDNSKYLNTTFEGKRNGAGALFVDKDHTGEFTDRNTFIYGHNMKNGSMFGRLREYRNKDFFEQYPYFYIYTPDGMEITYQVFSVAVVKDTTDSFIKTYNSDDEFASYINHIRRVSWYKSDVEVNADSKIVSLSTCTNVSDDERLLVHGVKISEKLVEE